MFRCLLISYLCLLSSCGSRKIPTINLPHITPGEIVHDWANYASYAGGMLIFASVLCMVWVSDKSIAVRLFANGFAFIAVAKLMSFLGVYMGWILLLCLISYVVLNAARVEKILAKMGLRIDINRDGVIGTHTTNRHEVDIFDGDTEVIERASVYG